MEASVLDSAWLAEEAAGGVVSLFGEPSLSWDSGVGGMVRFSRQVGPEPRRVRTPYTARPGVQALAGGLAIDRAQLGNQSVTLFYMRRQDLMPRAALIGN